MMPTIGATTYSRMTIGPMTAGPKTLTVVILNVLAKRSHKPKNACRVSQLNSYAEYHYSEFLYRGL